MASTDMAGDGLAPVARPRTRATYTVGVSNDWGAARPAWEAAVAAGDATPFQHASVIDAWYRAMAGRPEIEPCIVTVHEADGAHVMSLPLIRTTSGGMRTLACADLGLMDYNAPVLGPAAPADTAGAARLWRAVLRALPRADLIDLRKMPEQVGTRPNPLARLGTLPCPLNGNVVRTGEDWNAYHRALKRVFRKELERAWRVFERHPGATFRPIVAADERQRVLAAIEALQPVRMQKTGKTYALDEAGAAAFYRNLAAVPADEGSVVLTALTAGEEVVAALLGLRSGGDYVMVRISNAEGAWTNASPGRIIIDKSMEWLHGQGQRTFDFSIGNYDYKRRFGVEPFPLVDLVTPLSLRGLPAAADARARAWIRRYPKARATVERWLGRTPKQA